MDESIRRIERTTSLDWTPEDQERLLRSYDRMGLRVRIFDLADALTEWEEIQSDYDDLWWHASTPHKCGLWGGSHSGCFRDVDFRSSVFKAHHEWRHRWGGENSKRKTLRNHRDNRSRSKAYKPRREKVNLKEEIAPHERRRKKRYGGRGHLYSEGWVQNQQSGRWRHYWGVGTPDLDV